MAENAPIHTRKSQHIDLVATQDVEFRRSTGLERFELCHAALPEMDPDQIDLSCQFLGRHMAAPVLISGMTGGTDEAGLINRRLAQAACKIGLGMGVGSQRVMLEHESATETFQVRELAPDIPILANLGAVQLNYNITSEHCQRAVDSIDADGIALHCNSLQEAIQPEGTTNFSDLLDHLPTLTRDLSVPVVLKEIGCGMDGSTAVRALNRGVTGVDVGGAGGTCWTDIEGRRSTDPATRRLAEVFREWGTPTADSLVAVRRAVPGALIIASGGIRDGLDVAKALALGADVVSLAGPALKAARESSEAVVSLLENLVQELRLAMFCSGTTHMGQLRTRIRRID